MSPESVADLRPGSVWSRFDELTRIPRPSRKEEGAVEWIRAIARQHGWPVRVDGAGNLAVDAPATAGFEDVPVTTLQAHLDMVCEKNEGVDHDFDRDPIATEVVDGWVRARGTTLGADNGLGVAMALAAAEDPDVKHGPLELLLTLDEETGLHGALALDPALIRGRVLLNLDAEEEDGIYVGSAGSAGTVARVPLDRSPVAPDRETVELFVRGLRGGHSGMDIGEGRGNAIDIAAHAVDAVRRTGIDLRIVEWRGGGRRNAIPRECFVVVAFPPESRTAAAAAASAAETELLSRWSEDEPGLAVGLAEVDIRPAEALTAEATASVVDLLLAAPHGVQAMSRKVPGLVETSINLASAETRGGDLRVEWSYRSSRTPALGETADSIAGLCRLVGASLDIDPGYPGWDPQPSSEVVRRTIAAWERVTGKGPEVRAVHAGIECGIFVDRVPGLQAVSLGPDIRGAHSPSERASVASTARVWDILKDLLHDLARNPIAH